MGIHTINIESSQGKTCVDTGTHISRNIRSIQEYPLQLYNTRVYGPVTHCAWVTYTYMRQSVDCQFDRLRKVLHLAIICSWVHTRMSSRKRVADADGRVMCPHCNQYIAERMYWLHKRCFYESAWDQWLKDDDIGYSDSDDASVDLIS